MAIVGIPVDEDVEKLAENIVEEILNFIEKRYGEKACKQLLKYLLREALKYLVILIETRFKFTSAESNNVTTTI
jgi:hypothetical protein